MSALGEQGHPARRAPRGGWRASRSDLALVALVLLASLAPFADKAVHVDDPIAIWVAQQIREQPFDFYGFEFNWRGEAEPAHEISKNPPLAGYYLALAASVLGWSERAMHIAFFLPALAAAWGTLVLARRLSGEALTGALALVLSPAFLVSSTTLMVDVTMLALWIWSVVWWDRGLRRGERGSLLAAAVLAGLCPLAKYFGVALTPLLAAHALFLRVRWRRWVPFVVIPLGMIAAYNLASLHLYGRALLADAAAYAGMYRPEQAVQHFGRQLSALAFLGACSATVLGLAPLLVSRRQALLAVGAAGLVAVPLALAPSGVAAGFQSRTPLTPMLSAQIALWAVVGAGVLALAIADARETRAPESLLLLLWVFGTYCFASFLNWTVNARSILPLVPAVAILVARRIARRHPRPGRRQAAWRAGGLAAAAALALTIGRADQLLADSARQAARELAADYARPERTLWFQGHWGFQYYAQRLGAEPLSRRSRVMRGDLILQPLNNSYLWPLPGQLARRLEIRRVAGPTRCATMNQGVGGGFYAGTWGPLPFAFGAVAPESYAVYLVTRDAP